MSISFLENFLDTFETEKNNRKVKGLTSEYNAKCANLSINTAQSIEIVRRIVTCPLWLFDRLHVSKQRLSSVRIDKTKPENMEIALQIDNPNGRIGC